VLFPDPDGPIIAVSSPDRNLPFTPLSIVLKPLRRPSETEYEISLNEMSTGGRFGRCVSVTYTQSRHTRRKKEKNKNRY
jgi:hypothetical protein